MMEYLFYFGFAVALGLAVWLGLKYKVTSTQLSSVIDVMTLMKLVNKQFNFQQQDDLERVMDYIVGLTNFLIPYVEKNEVSDAELLKAILEDTHTFCVDNNVKMNGDFIQIIDTVANFIVLFWLK